MKKLSSKASLLVCGLIIGILIASPVNTLAKSLSQTVDIVYRNIKITLDGKEITPKDVDGNIVEPFVINGTTYLPVRAIANALGLPVGWDEPTSTVKLGDQGQQQGDNNLNNEIANTTYKGRDAFIKDGVTYVSSTNIYDLSSEFDCKIIFTASPSSVVCVIPMEDWDELTILNTKQFDESLFNGKLICYYTREDSSSYAYNGEVFGLATKHFDTLEAYYNSTH